MIININNDIILVVSYYRTNYSNYKKHLSLKDGKFLLGVYFEIINHSLEKYKIPSRVSLGFQTNPRISIPTNLRIKTKSIRL